MLTFFTIESIDIAKVYIRNTGQNPISSLSVYINDEPAIYNVTPSQIAPGQVGTVTIYDFIAEGDTIKITSSNGFSTSKKAPDPCAKAVGCWKFDEGSGTTAYDSSPYGNTLTLANNPLWTSGLSDNALSFDGVDDFVYLSDFTSYDPIDAITVAVWVRPLNGESFTVVNRRRSTSDFTSFGISWSTASYNRFYGKIGTVGSGTSTFVYQPNGQSPPNNWYFVVLTYSRAEGLIKLYVNGQLVDSKVPAYVTNIYYETDARLFVGDFDGGTSPGNKIIDEIRIYNRAIY